MLNWLESMQMKEDKKRWMELQMAMLPLVTDLGLFMGEGWKSLAGSTELCFQFPTHLPQLLSTPDAGQFERQSYSDPYLSEDSNPGPGNVKQGSSGHHPPWQQCARETISHPLQTFWKWDEKAWERPGITKAKPKDGGKFLPQENFSKSQVLIWGLSKATLQSKKDRDGEGSVDSTLLSLAELLGVQGWRLQWASPGKKAVVKATGAVAISLGKVSMVVTCPSPVPVLFFHLMLIYSRKTAKPQVVSKHSYQITS